MTGSDWWVVVALLSIVAGLGAGAWLGWFFMSGGEIG